MTNSMKRVVAMSALLVRDVAAALSAEMQEVLDKHNIYRCMHGVPAFTWDDAIATSAQTWANNGKFEHSTIAQRTVGGVECGENLAWGSPTYPGPTATRDWYKEIDFTSPYGTADSMSDSTPAGKDIGHYTQVVWAASTKLGCGKGTESSMGGELWVCQYGPGGNVGGSFTTQVKAPVKTAEQCGGTAADNGSRAPKVGAATSDTTRAAPLMAAAVAVAAAVVGRCF